MAPDHGHSQPDEAPQPHAGGRDGVNRRPKGLAPSSKSSRPPSLTPAGGFPRQPPSRARVSSAWTEMPACTRERRSAPLVREMTAALPESWKVTLDLVGESERL